MAGDPCATTPLMTCDASAFTEAMEAVMEQADLAAFRAGRVERPSRHRSGRHVSRRCP